MLLQTSEAQAAADHVVDLGPIGGAGAGSARRPAGQGITLSLVHLDVALAVEAQVQDEGRSADGASCFRVSAKRLAQASEGADRASAFREFGDPVLRRLSDALAATRAAHDAHSAICADALRLAILARKFSRQTAPGQADIASTPLTREDHACRRVRSLQQWRLRRVLQFIDEHLGTKITLEELARVAGLSRMHFAAQFRAAVGVRPHEYLLKRRIERAEDLLKQTAMPLVEVALSVGFQTQSHFTTVFKRFAGDTPRQWRCAYLAQSAAVPAAPRSPS